MDRIGKYPVLRKLGEGATSTVYLCQDPFNNRQVAVKRVNPEALQDAQGVHSTHDDGDHRDREEPERAGAEHVKGTKGKHSPIGMIGKLATIREPR